MLLHRFHNCYSIAAAAAPPPPPTSLAGRAMQCSHTIDNELGRSFSVKVVEPSD